MTRDFMGENAGFLILIAAALLIALYFAIQHAILTRRSWRQGAEARAENVEQLLHPMRTYNAVWGLDTRRAVKRISKLRREDAVPKISPHLVVGVSADRLALVFGARGDHGVTTIYRSEFRSIKTATSAFGMFTTWYVACSVRGQKITLPIRVSDPSSDFLTADYTWADAAAGTISAVLNGEVHASEVGPR